MIDTADNPQTQGPADSGVAAVAGRNVGGVDGAVECSALGSLLGPTASIFGQTHWDQTPCHSQGTGSFNDLLSLAEVDALLSDRGLRTPFLRVGSEGVARPSAQFTRSGGVGATLSDQIADDRVADLLADGNSLVLQGLHRTHPAVGAFTRRLAADLGHPVQADAHLTPSGNRGLATQYDIQDVFVCQLSGSQEWRIHPPVITRPHRDQPWELVREQVAQAADSEPSLAIRMNPGDCLYLPRGWLHSAGPVGADPSLHLTFGVQVVTKMDLLHVAVAHLASDEATRTAMPLGEELGGGFAALIGLRELTTLLSQLPADQLAGLVRRRRDADTRPEPLSPLRQAEAIRTLDHTSTVRRRTNLGLTQSGSATGIHLVSALDPQPLTFDWQLSDALKHLLSGDDVLVGSLPGPAPQVHGAINCLLRAGILTASDVG